MGSRRMITPATLRGCLRAQPFRPFRLHMASGRTFEIRHPEMVRMGRSDIVVFSLVDEDPDLYDHWDTVSLMLIENISHLDVAVPQS